MGESSSLFRSEAVGGPSRKLGSVQIHQPWGYTVAAILALLFTALVTAFGYFGTYTRKATVVGLLMPEQGVLRLTAHAAGVLSNIAVIEGQAVESGDMLFTISGERFSGAGGTEQLIAEQLNQRLLLLERSRLLADERLEGQSRMLDSRLRTIDEEHEGFTGELRFLQRRVVLAEQQLQRQQDLMRSHHTSVSELQQAEIDLLALQGQQQTLRRAQSNLNRERMELLAQQQELELRHRDDISEIENGITLIRQEQAENEVRTQQVSTAPFSGIVAGLNVQQGQQMTAGMLLASLIPHDATLVAHLYANARQAGFVERGQTVLMRHAAYPYQRFGMTRGTVTQLAMTPYALQELPVHIASALTETSESADLYYRITVELDAQFINVYGAPQPLQTGMLLEADIVQDRRRLYEWALEPVYSVIGKRESVTK